MGMDQRFRCSVLGLLFLTINVLVRNSKSSTEIDPNGYLFFCLCMGRFGNQMEHLLGGISFAKKINRTLVIPPLRTYQNVEFDEWFQKQPMCRAHRMILARDFMDTIAPKIWTPEKRYGFCYQIGSTPCFIKEGNPFTNFWDELKVDFVDHVYHQLGTHEPHRWIQEFPGGLFDYEYPVIALKGAPASFPMEPNDVKFQENLKFSYAIRKEAEGLLMDAFGSKDLDYLAIHLRIGSDWEKACQHTQQDIPGMKFMASYQCQGWRYRKPLTPEQCFNQKEEILKKVTEVVKEYNFKKVLIASDVPNAYVQELEEALKDREDMNVKNPNPHLPVVDAFLLSHSRYFIGNCVSSFSAFAWRHRQAHHLGPSAHFAAPDDSTTRPSSLPPLSKHSSPVHREKKLQTGLPNPHDDL